MRHLAAMELRLYGGNPASKNRTKDPCCGKGMCF